MTRQFSAGYRRRGAHGQLTVGRNDGNEPRASHFRGRARADRPRGPVVNYPRLAADNLFLPLWALVA